MKKILILKTKNPYAYPIVYGIKKVEIIGQLKSDINLDDSILIMNEDDLIVGEVKLQKLDYDKRADLWYKYAIDSLISYTDFNNSFSYKKHKGFALKFFKQKKFDNPFLLKDLNIEEKNMEFINEQ